VFLGFSSEGFSHYSAATLREASHKWPEGFKLATEMLNAHTNSQHEPGGQFYSSEEKIVDNIANDLDFKRWKQRRPEKFPRLNLATAAWSKTGGGWCGNAPAL
jgi:hypothetical protein